MTKYLALLLLATTITAQAASDYVTLSVDQKDKLYSKKRKSPSFSDREDLLPVLRWIFQKVLEDPIWLHDGPDKGLGQRGFCRSGKFLRSWPRR